MPCGMQVHLVLLEMVGQWVWGVCRGWGYAMNSMIVHMHAKAAKKGAAVLWKPCRWCKSA